MTDNTLMPAAEPEVGTSRTTLLVAGGLVAALVLGGGGYVLLSGGSDDDLGTGAPAVSRTKTGTVAKTVPTKRTVAKPAAAKPGVLPTKTTVRIGRDPFRALYVQPVAAVAPAAPTGTSTTTSSGSTSSGSTSTPGTTTGATYALTLKQISTSGDAKVFTFNVDGVMKTVLAAQRFGKYGELVVLSWVKNSKGAAVGAVFQVGDDEPLVIRVGEKLSVQ